MFLSDQWLRVTTLTDTFCLCLMIWFQGRQLHNILIADEARVLVEFLEDSFYD